MRLSVVVPTLNEEFVIRDAIGAARAALPSAEIIVADGGSRDLTALHATDADRLVHAPRGRARQMNAGAAQSTGDLLVFLHADSRLPASAAVDIGHAIRRGAEAGTFRLRFDARSPLLDLYAAATTLSIPALTFGDRGLFVRRDAFKAVGGFADIPLFEDVDIVRRLARRDRFAFLRSSVTTSARRFASRGVLRQQLRNAALWTAYMLGTPPDVLARLYPYP